jgi:hypothetical protein
MTHGENSTAALASPTVAVASREREKPQCRFAPADVLSCPRCGLALHAATIEHEQALVFASCCPRCDGPLPPIETAGTRERIAA